MQRVRELAIGVAVAAVLVFPTLTVHAAADEECEPMTIVEQWSGHNSAQDAPRRVVIRDDDDWEQLWKAMHGRIIPMPEVPEVDFQKHMVLGAFMGTKRTGGYAVRITRVVQNDRIVVSVRERAPGPGDMVTMALTSPYHVVVVPLSEKPVKFVEDREAKKRRP